MDYLALYRKYRPTDFSSVVGQNEIKKILSTAINQGNITHAYLFSGPRGTGKTTMAKILAKMVNCEHLVDGEPCNKCNSCINLFNSNDVIEIDAASNNGVDEIRDLREKATLVPSVCKYKVYIIDEVHMLTTQAFNALLKILEEPPKHVIFILATTEYHKIPLTITSRCQKFQFNKLEIEDIVKRLREISDLEKIDIDDEALYEIAKISDGGMRDSINFLDQIRSFTSNMITVNDVYEVCGDISVLQISNLLIYLKENNVEKITEFFEEMSEKGKNFNKLLEDIVGYLKDVILYRNNVNEKLIKCDTQYIKKVSEIYDDKDIYYIVDKINSLINELRYVSRQTIVITANFLLIMYKINENKELELNLNRNVNAKNEENDNYNLAFNFTKNIENEKCELTSENLHSVDSEEINNNEEYNENKEIIINNAFALASKKLKKSLQEKFISITDYLTDNKYSLAASLFVDLNAEVVGEGYIIFTGKYDAIVDKVNHNYRKCDEFIEVICGNNYKFVVITISQWEKYRDEYINNIKNGKKYEIMEFQNTIIDKDVMDKEPTVVDKLFDLVGEESVEFK